MCMKILIVKMGYSETLDPEIGIIPSLGDVLRTTPILYALKEKFPDSHVTWLVSKHAEPLLKGNQMIDRLLVWDEFVPFQLMREKIDVLINLEKVPGIAALSDMIDAWTKYGFRYDGTSGVYHSYERGLDFISYIKKKQDGKVIGDFWQKVLIEMLGVPWSEQPYVIGYQPKSKPTFDIGLNFQVGSKWPTKAMPMEHWQKLEEGLLARGYTVSWQQGLGDLYDYMDWIYSCGTVISQDSLGIHIAFAYGKKVLGLFGPTDPTEIHLYRQGKYLIAGADCPSMPCYAPSCGIGHNCMNTFDPEVILESVEEVIAM